MKFMTSLSSEAALPDFPPLTPPIKAGVKDILLLDKMEAFGGNSCLCGGLMSVPLNPKQQKQGIKDSVDLIVADMTKAGRGFNHPDLAKKIRRKCCQHLPDARRMRRSTHG